MADDPVTLRQFLDRAILDYERHHAELHAELQRAVVLADEALAERTQIALNALDKRLDSMNEFRASLEDVTNRAVSRDLFDLVTNRVTIIENTYVQKQEYGKDTDLARDRYIQDLNQRDIRIAALERNTVKNETLDTQRNEIERTRKALIYSVIGGGVLIGLNLVFNLLQSKP